MCIARIPVSGGTQPLLAGDWDQTSLIHTTTHLSHYLCAYEALRSANWSHAVTVPHSSEKTVIHMSALEKKKKQTHEW